jgi:hypothetical protein
VTELTIYQLYCISQASSTSDDLSSSSAKRSRLLLSSGERDQLEHHFTHVSNAPSESEMADLVTKLANPGFTLARCKLWFVNRRSADSRRAYYQQYNRKKY